MYLPAALFALGAAVCPAALVTFSAPATLRAQAAQGVVAGLVVAEGTQRPVADAQVSVEGTTLGGATDANGRFRIAGVAGAEVRITVRRIGYRPNTVTARVGATDVRVTLSERALELSQVVVTGTAGVAERRAVGNAVSTVNASDVVATQPVRSLQDLLTGRAAGVSVVASSGQVGSGSRIRVRGASSLALTNDPLIYVDGVRVDREQATGPTNQAFGSRSISRFNDFDPDDIESIEVIKGPAAATLYGTEASNGVIQIITKRGAAGAPQWNLTYRGGANWVPDWEDRFFTNYGVVPRAGSATARDTVTIDVRQLNESLNRVYGNDIFRTGRLNDVQLGVSGGNPAFRYFASGNYEENQGAERVNGLRRRNFRVNLTATPGTRWEVQSSMGYTGGRTYLPYESGGGGATWATYFASPAFRFSGAADTNPQLGFRSGPPNVYYQAYNIFQDADRYTGSAQLTHRPTPWLNHRLIVGIDRLAEDNQTLGPRNDVIFSRFSAFSDVGGTNPGFVRVNTRGATNTTFDYAANAQFDLSRALRSVTSVGGQYYGRRVLQREVAADSFALGGVAILSAGGRRFFDLDEVIENNTVGAFVQQQLVWRDRLFLTGAVRTDDNSAFGTNFDAVTYPKVSASYVLSEEPALRLPSLVNTLRARAAYGASGLQPGTFDAIRSYTLTGTGGFIRPLSPGNPDLGPERSTELELGLDLGAFRDRFTAELTYFDGSTRDAILSRQSPPSGGFSDLQLFNAGRVDRSGFEWLLRAQPIQRPNLSLDLTLSGSALDYEIRSLGANQVVSVTAQVQHVVGYAPGAWWDRRVVAADKNPATGAVSNLRCDDGLGGSVACASAPRVFLGNSVPTTEGSFTAGLGFLRDFRVNAFFDWRGGYKKLDGNRRVRCNLFALCRENYFPQDPQYDAVMLAEVQGGTAFTYNLIQDASFTRFRELSLTYTVPTTLVQRLSFTRASVTFAGRNLGLWTNYPGIDPEASFNGGTRGGSYGQWEQNVLPQLRQFVTTINLGF
jgi:TonB-linked SusC/RagA family outer membrane protein